ncbi:Adenosine deaminase 2-A like protein [Verticillium longisporum]|uniref:adenosine deaminase n=1 Tax=Verticillium longisporum TaxID=100787 RepID=A0A8I3AU54_VERLO|nr:Adenosine deaminase 2-A like protein [Verticillium longisporum]
MSLSDEDYAQLAQEIPSPDEPFLRQFTAGSARLQDQESALRADTGFRNSLSPLARRAATIVTKIRERENETVWTGQQALRTPFALAKPLLETTDLWRIIRRLPKGGVLNANLSNMVDIDWLLDVLFKTPGMHIWADAPLDSSKALEGATVKFGFRQTETSEASVWTSGYVPGTWRGLKKAANEFNDGGESLRSETGSGRNVSYRRRRCFEITESIISYEPIFRAFLRHLMSTLHAENINWIELRVTLGLGYCRQSRETPETDYDHMYHVIDEELARFKSEASHPSFWGLRLIWTSNRALPRRALIQDMDNCLTTKLTYPSLIAGYDVCGRREDAGRSLKDLLPELFWFKKQCAQERVEVPFLFHAGENLAAGGILADEDLYDAILLGTRRLGSAQELHRHPLLVDLVKEKRIVIETSPFGSELLRISEFDRTNPLPALIARGVPCSLGSDCPAALRGAGAIGPSHDYWKVLQGWGGLGLEGLGALAENGVRWAAFEDEDAKAWGAGVREASLGRGIKAQRLKQWATAWEEFCLWIVTEYGEELGDEPGDIQGRSLDIEADRGKGKAEP